MCENSVNSCIRFRFCGRAVAVASLMAIVLSGQALAIDWTNTTGVPDPWYHVGSNWAGGVAPGPNETANFNQATTYEVWWDSTTASKFLGVLAGEVAFLNNGGGTQHGLIIYGSGDLDSLFRRLDFRQRHDTDQSRIGTGQLGRSTAT